MELIRIILAFFMIVVSLKQQIFLNTHYNMFGTRGTIAASEYQHTYETIPIQLYASSQCKTQKDRKQDTSKTKKSTETTSTTSNVSNITRTSTPIALPEEQNISFSPVRFCLNIVKHFQTMMKPIAMAMLRILKNTLTSISRELLRLTLAYIEEDWHQVSFIIFSILRNQIIPDHIFSTETLHTCKLTLAHLLLYKQIPDWNRLLGHRMWYEVAVMCGLGCMSIILIWILHPTSWWPIKLAYLITIGVSAIVLGVRNAQRLGMDTLYKDTLVHVLLILQYSGAFLPHLWPIGEYLSEM